MYLLRSSPSVCLDLASIQNEGGGGKFSVCRSMHKRVDIKATPAAGVMACHKQTPSNSMLARNATLIFFLDGKKTLNVTEIVEDLEKIMKVEGQNVDEKPLPKYRKVEKSYSQHARTKLSEK